MPTLIMVPLPRVPIVAANVMNAAAHFVHSAPLLVAKRPEGGAILKDIPDGHRLAVRTILQATSGIRERTRVESDPSVQSTLEQHACQQQVGPEQARRVAGAEFGKLPATTELDGQQQDGSALACGLDPIAVGLGC